jgi:hypothetical protein
MLKAVADRDLSGLGDKLFFFLDRDFDIVVDDCDEVFTTDRHSVENYLVDEAVLSELLKNEFHCHGRPDIRESILGLFNSVYDQFLLNTREVNRRLFTAARDNIPLTGSLPDRIAGIANVTLRSAEAVPASPAEIVPLQREPSSDVWSKYAQGFDALEPRLRYRGKFALLFFKRWLEELSREYGHPASNLFRDLDRGTRARVAELVLSNFASKSRMPDQLDRFLSQIPTTA